MRHYELMIMLSDALDDEAAEQFVARVESLVADAGGRVVKTDYWGRRPLAYEISHRHQAYYAVFDLEIAAADLAGIERQLKLSDDVIRFKTIRPDVRVRKPSEVRARRPA